MRVRGSGASAAGRLSEFRSAQNIRSEKPRRKQLESAFSDILVSPGLLGQLGPAICAGKGMFIYGPPGNGKTTIAQRITRCFGQTIFVPHAIVEDGQIIKLFDGSCHQQVRSAAETLLRDTEFDRRWVRIQRPTVMVGGELTMDNLELKHNANSNVSEASLQLKSNCGCLLIDDFGRQRVNPVELLNRWIVPLENRVDYLTLANGKKVEVPFEQLIIFSTNLEPHKLADDAFLRRIPFKIEIGARATRSFTGSFNSSRLRSASNARRRWSIISFGSITWLARVLCDAATLAICSSKSSIIANSTKRLRRSTSSISTTRSAITSPRFRARWRNGRWRRRPLKLLRRLPRLLIRCGRCLELVDQRPDEQTSRIVGDRFVAGEGR